MIKKLLLKDVSFKQLLGFTLILSIGLSIILLTGVLYIDFNKLFTPNKGTFSKEYISINKKVNLLSNLNKSQTLFTKQEIETLRKQPAVSDISAYTTAGFDITGYVSIPGKRGVSTKLFFESVESRFIDIDLKDWKWNENSSTLPIIIPRSYLTLYNFGFAPSQGLPIISEGMIQQIPLTIRIQGQGKEIRLQANIVGLSDRINSILIPMDFMNWANSQYAEADQDQKVSRLLLACNDISNKDFISFLNKNQYESSSDTDQSSKMKLYFRLGMIFVLFIGLLFVGISLYMISLSVSLLLQKSKQNIYSLYSIGVAPKDIERFYQKIIITLSLVGTGISCISVLFCQHIYRNYLHELINMDFPSTWGVVILFIALLFVCTSLINLSILHSKIKENLKY